jgi:hypothetical protein
MSESRSGRKRRAGEDEDAALNKSDAAEAETTVSNTRRPAQKRKIAPGLNKEVPSGAKIFHRLQPDCFATGSVLVL